MIKTTWQLTEKKKRKIRSKGFYPQVIEARRPAEKLEGKPSEASKDK